MKNGKNIKKETRAQRSLHSYKTLFLCTALALLPDLGFAQDGARHVGMAIELQTQEHAALKSEKMRLALNDSNAAASVPSTSASDDTNAAPQAQQEDASTQEMPLPNPDVTPYEGLLDKLQALQRENMLLKLQIQNTKLKKSLEEEEAVKGKKGGDSADLNLLSSSMAGDTPFSVRPQITAISGVGGSRRATIFVPGDGQFFVSPGQVMPNGWKVKVIESNAIYVTTPKGDTLKLLYYAH